MATQAVSGHGLSLEGTIMKGKISGALIYYGENRRGPRRPLPLMREYVYLDAGWAAWATGVRWGYGSKVEGRIRSIMKYFSHL